MLKNDLSVLLKKLFNLTIKREFQFAFEKKVISNFILFAQKKKFKEKQLQIYEKKMKKFNV